MFTLPRARAFPASPSLRYSECHSALSIYAQGFRGYFFETIKQLLSVPLMWVVNRDSLKVSPDRAMCREALRSSGKAARSGGLGEGLGPRGQQPGTEGKGPEQHGDSAP